MPDGGKISISAENLEVDAAFSSRHPAIPAGDYATLTVKDTGVGMNSETQSCMWNVEIGDELEPEFTELPEDVRTEVLAHARLL
jgi:hypothetical protein